MHTVQYIHHACGTSIDIYLFINVHVPHTCSITMHMHVHVCGVHMSSEPLTLCNVEHDFTSSHSTCTPYN